MGLLEDYMVANDVDPDALEHYGVKGMKWGVRKKDGSAGSGKADPKDPLKNPVLAVKAKLFSVGVQVAPRELSYGVKRALSNPSADDRLLSTAALESAKLRGVLPNNQRLSNAIEKTGIEKHKAAKYDLDSTDLDRLKKYTDAAWYSRSVNSFLATGDPAAYAKRSAELKATIGKNTISDTTVFRSTSLNFSFNGVAKKLESMSEGELAKSFDSFSKNYKGKTFKENRVFSTSTSPNFAIDTWRKVNPNAAANYNTYMIINTKNTPGLLADGRTTKGGKIVNTRSNQEGILAPTRMRYESLAFDQERGMFAITVTALGDDD
jgi:hypothetical protein